MKEARNTVLPYLRVSNQTPMTLLEFGAKLEEQAEATWSEAIEECNKKVAEMENPYSSLGAAFYNGFERCRQDVLALLGGKNGGVIE